MRKIWSLLLSIVLMVATFCVPVLAAEGNTVTSLEDNHANVKFSNGYHGFCIDMNLDDADANDQFEIHPTTQEIVVKNNITGEDVSHHIKILFVNHFDEYFVENADGDYVFKYEYFDYAHALQADIWAFTDRTQAEREAMDDPAIDAVMEAYNSGLRIPDHGHAIYLENGSKVTFDFSVFLSGLTNEEGEKSQQDFFAYKLTVEKHTHEFGEEWLHDGEKHWHECECGQVSAEDVHEEEIRNQVEPEEFEDGYSGDVYCLVCNELIEEGEIIPQTHEHEYTDKYDDEKHWEECSCEDVTNEEEHTLGDWEVIEEATETEDGKKVRSCSECDYEEEDIIEATGSEGSGETGDLDSEGESGESERVESPDNQDEADKETTLPDNSDKTDTPETGDETNLMLWVALMVVSGSVIFSRRKFA